MRLEPDYKLVAILSARSATLVRRAVRLRDQVPVILKGLQAERSTQAGIARLRHEYRVLLLLQKLGCEHVIRPLELIGEDASTTLVLEDIGGTALAEQGTQRLWPMQDLLHVGGILARALAGVHQAGVIHKDVNPNNIVFNPSTRAVQLIDFGISAQIETELQGAGSVHDLEGTLEYAAPEQTGRVNRHVDYRTDFYSLGATLYEMACGRPVHDNADAGAFLHALLTVAPTPPHQVEAHVPVGVSQLIVKLLQKAPEDRYQSALGIHADLQACSTAWQQTGTVAEFALAQHEQNERFALPQRLYGRDAELQSGRTCLLRACTGKRELLVVEGASGIGKSALIQALQPSALAQQALWAGGKYDQLSRHIPLTAFRQAMGALVQQFLRGTEAEVDVWRRRLHAAVGAVGALLNEIVPSAELLLGPMPALPPLHPRENENRLLFMVKRLIVALASNQPLVLHLDDMQWADAGTLQLLRTVMTGAEPIAGLMLILSYRDNEVGPTHPVARLFDDLRAQGVAIQKIVLEPLPQSSTLQLIVDTTHASPAEAQGLALLLEQKTHGNPFFLREYLRRLHAQRLIYFDVQAQRWRWNIEAIGQAAAADNVVALLAQMIADFPEDVRTALATAACLGDVFTLGDLQGVLGLSRAATVQALNAPMASGIVMPLTRDYRYAADTATGVAYKFAHDRVQKAAYDTLSAAQALACHLRVGRHLEAQMARRKDVTLFAVLEQLNRASALLTGEDERLALARQNLLGAQEAKRAAAYPVAITYLAAAQALLGSTAQQKHAALWREIGMEYSDNDYLLGNFAAAADRIDALAAAATGPAERIDVARRRVLALTAVNKQREALEAGFAALKLLGVDLDMEVGTAGVVAELVRTQFMLRKFKLDSLHTLPDLTDANIRAAMDVMQSIILASFVQGANLFVVLFLRQVQLALRYGGSIYSAYAFSNLGAVFAGMNNYANARKMYISAAAMLERFPASPNVAGVHLGQGVSTNFTTVEGSVLVPHYRRGFIIGQESGDPVMGNWCAVFGAYLLMYMNLEAALNECVTYQEYTRNFAHAQHAISYESMHWVIERWREPAVAPPEDAAVLAKARGVGGTGFAYWATVRMAYRWTAGQYQAGRALLDMMGDDKIFLSMVEHGAAFTAVYGLLCQHACQRQKAPLSKNTRGYVKTLDTKLRAMAADGTIWQGPLSLIDAEAADVAQQYTRAAALYERAIDALRDSSYTAFTAAAWECAGMHYARRGLAQPAHHHLLRACEAYSQLGATGKVRWLEAQMPALAEARRLALRVRPEGPITRDPANRNSGNLGGEEGLDISALLRVSQALAAELPPEELAQRAVKSLAEVTDATRVCLFVQGSAEPTKQADTGDSTTLPPQLLAYVMRSKQSLLVDDLAHHPEFAADAASPGVLAKSVLCLPVRYLGKLTALAYLENRLTTHAFTPLRYQLAEVLVANVATSLESRRAFTHLEDLVAQRSQELQEAAARLLTLEKDATEMHMAGGFAHEVGNALSGVGYMLSSLARNPFYAPGEDEVPLDERLHQALEQLSQLELPAAAATQLHELRDIETLLNDISPHLASGVSRAQRITQLIMNYARASSIVAGDDATDLGAVVNQVAKEYAEELQKADIACNIEIQGAPVAFIREEHAYAIVRNLVANARDAMRSQPKGTTRQVHIQVQSAHGRVATTVSDTGPGIDADNNKFIFRPFYSTKGGRGTGLGLSFSRKLVVAYGGRISFTSEPQEGTTFSVDLPAATPLGGKAVL